MAQSCRIYIQRLSPNEDVQQKLQEYHNSIFKELKDSKLFRAWNGIEFLASAGDSRYPKAKALISSINEKWGTKVADTTFTGPTAREYIFVNVRNLLQRAEEEVISTPKQGKLSFEEFKNSLPRKDCE